MTKFLNIFKGLFILLFFLSGEAFAGMGSGPPQPCGGPFPPCPIPVDSNIIFLIAAGLFYLGWKLYTRSGKIRM